MDGAVEEAVDAALDDAGGRVVVVVEVEVEVVEGVVVAVDWELAVESITSFWNATVC